MAKKWYVLHTYSGYENKVRQNLLQRIEAMGLEDKIFKIEIPTETVIMALGTAPNPLIVKTTNGLEATRRGGLVADEEGRTTREGIFAGGDAVTGAATVILAMGAGRKAAKAIDEYLKSK